MNKSPVGISCENKVFKLDNNFNNIFTDLMGAGEEVVPQRGEEEVGVDQRTLDLLAVVVQVGGGHLQVAVEVEEEAAPRGRWRSHFLSG